MARIGWYVNRLRAMNLPEVVWRLKQKKLQRHEAKQAVKLRDNVCGAILYPELCERFADRTGSIVTPASLPFDGEPFVSLFGCTPEASIHLLGGYDYDTFKERWNAGFDTEAVWPSTQSYALRYKQRDDIGDARINWELNRCFQFALLARRGDVDELERLVDSWSAANKWLIGISWTSVMEVAIRAIQWTVAAYFLSLLAPSEKIVSLKKKLETGALNMTEYVTRHYSRYSSANNHLLVEACCMVIVGHAFDYKKWEELGMSLLDKEIDRQNFPDGVNKEMALHYQTFAMEAYLLAAIVSGSVPQRWKEPLERLRNFVEWSVSAGPAMEWGDNDEGKIIDLRGGKMHADHYRYVLGLCDHLRLYTIESPKLQCVCHFPEGGYTFGRSADGKVLVGIDHAPLGFGSIAAHGHADALSVQLIYDGHAIFTDPGTYVYHRDLPSRNDYRRTINHNTICIDGKDQSEMLGAFLWGKRAIATGRMIESNPVSGAFVVKASHDGYKPVIHERTLSFDGKRHLEIDDRLSADAPYTLTFMLGSKVKAKVDGDTAILTIRNHPVAKMIFEGAGAKPTVEKSRLSAEFGIETEGEAIRLRAVGDHILTKIDLLPL